MYKTCIDSVFADIEVLIISVCMRRCHSDSAACFADFVIKRLVMKIFAHDSIRVC